MTSTVELTDEEDAIDPKQIGKRLVEVHTNGITDEIDQSDYYVKEITRRTTTKHEAVTRKSTSLDRLSQKSRSCNQNNNMPSQRTQSVEKLDGVSLPFGSEKIVSVKRRSKNGTGKTQPLSINTTDPRMFSTSEGDLTMRKFMRRQKKIYSGVYEDPKTHRYSLYNTRQKTDDSRRSYATNSVLFDPSNDRRRVISCLELNIPEPSELEVSPVEITRNEDVNGPTSVPVFADNRANQGTFVFPREPSRIKTHREREIYMPSRAEENGCGMRYSGIFVPDSLKRRSRSRQHLRKSRSSNLYQQQPTPMWSPFVPVAMNLCSNCMMPTCQRCRNSISSPRKSFSQDVLCGNIHPYETMDARESQYFEMPQAPLPPYPPSAHHHHHHHQQQQRHRMSSYFSNSRMSDIDRAHRVSARTNLLNTSVEDLDDYGYEKDRLVDLLEIEYASVPDENITTHLSSKDLNLIYTMARDAAASTDELESMARHLKMTLDRNLGEKWHVVVGIDSFGSNLASLPGALANFKVDKYVFLMWRT
ncbi:hypothetical protein FGIG_10914 [Fasciola gigantica]|uniref:Uncharacterized protein n=1 Tax=Fasciola gigantica TaxID=46835 RepID=A0A504YH82_FASGI|nr:hypothetical protein FGIG_10914 [Fasciola gigantica]